LLDVLLEAWVLDFLGFERVAVNTSASIMWGRFLLPSAFFPRLFFLWTSGPTHLLCFAPLPPAVDPEASVVFANQPFLTYTVMVRLLLSFFLIFTPQCAFFPSSFFFAAIPISPFFLQCAPRPPHIPSPFAGWMVRSPFPPLCSSRLPSLLHDA